MLLDKRNALVFGSSQGIGLATAIELSRQGASLTLVARNEDTLQMAVDKLDRSHGQEHLYLTIDMARGDQLRELLGEHIKQRRNYHIIVNNSGGPPPGHLHKASPKDLQVAFAQHIVSAQIALQLTLSFMRAAKYGRIINIISVAAKEPVIDLGVSNTIRGAMVNWAKSLSSELGGFGITVNNILPGFTATGRAKRILEAIAESQGLTVEEAERKVLSTIPAARMADPSETAAAVAFLASPNAAFINGINLPVDGGQLRSI